MYPRTPRCYLLSPVLIFTCRLNSMISGQLNDSGQFGVRLFTHIRFQKTSINWFEESERLIEKPVFQLWRNWFTNFLPAFTKSIDWRAIEFIHHGTIENPSIAASAAFVNGKVMDFTTDSICLFIHRNIEPLKKCKNDKTQIAPPNTPQKSSTNSGCTNLNQYIVSLFHM